MVKRIIAIKGAGEMATGVAIRLYRAGFGRVFMMERKKPLAVRRTVSFCEAIHEGSLSVEGVEAVRVTGEEEIRTAWREEKVPVIADPSCRILKRMVPDVLVDGTLAKRNLGTRITDAPMVIGLGPGFTAAEDVHLVVETMRGHDIGRVIHRGGALANTGIPAEIGGHTVDRVLRAPVTGTFLAAKGIGDPVRAGERVGSVQGEAVVARIDGILRGAIRDGTMVRTGVKIGDIDPLGLPAMCHTVSDKARAIGGGVLEAILSAPLEAAGGRSRQLSS